MVVLGRQLRAASSDKPNSRRWKKWGLQQILSWGKGGRSERTRRRRRRTHEKFMRLWDPQGTREEFAAAAAPQCPRARGIFPKMNIRTLSTRVLTRVMHAPCIAKHNSHLSKKLSETVLRASPSCLLTGQFSPRLL